MTEAESPHTGQPPAAPASPQGVFRVHLEMHVRGDSGSCSVERDIVLPFPPFVGLEIIFGDEERGEIVAEVVWQMRQQRFLLAMEGWQDAKAVFEQQLALLGKKGWRVVQDTLRWE